MKILQVVPFFYPAWFYGGPTKLVYELSNYLAKNKHRVTVYTTDAFDDKKRMPKEAKLSKGGNPEVFYFRNLNNFLAFKWKIFLPIGIILSLRKNIREFDVVHIHDLFNLLTISTAFFCVLYKKPFVLSAHGTLGSIPLKQKSIAKNLSMALFGRWILRRASFLVAHSRHEAEEFGRLGIARDKIAILPTGLDWSEYKNLPQSGLFRKKYRIGDGVRIILYLGRIHRLKGVDLLLDSFRALQGDKLKLVFAGSDDGYLPELKRKIRSFNLEDKVLILGVTVGREKLSLYRDSDIFVFPSYVLACPLTFMTNLEVLAAGLPLVTTADCPDCELEKEHAGILVRPTVEELVGGIKFFLEDKQKLKSYSQNARKLIEDKFTWEKNVFYYEKLYRRVL